MSKQVTAAGMDGNRLRSFTWDDYGISKGRYMELQGFCIQYRQKKKDVKRISDYALALAAVTEAEAAEGAALRRYQWAERAMCDCRMIEEAAMWAADAGGYKSAWQAILRNVTDGIGYDNLVDAYKIPFSVADSYGMRRAFFHRLDQLQNGAGSDDNSGKK